jgi:hypothetical protein
VLTLYGHQFYGWILVYRFRGPHVIIIGGVEIRHNATSQPGYFV